MGRYYFDTIIGNEPIQDDEGLELAGLPIARDQALQALGDMGPELVTGHSGEAVEIYVRDEAGVRLIRVMLSFEIEILAQ
jgi:hypothetical protein